MGAEMATPANRRIGTGFLRRLGLLDTTFLVIGAVVGSGIFMTPGLIAAGLPSPGLLLAVWLAGGLITLCGALSFAELGAMYPQAGGPVHLPPRGLRPGRGLPFRLGLFRVHHVRRTGRPGRRLRRIPGLVRPGPLDRPRPLPARGPGLSYSLSAGQVVAAASILFLTFLNSFGIRSGAVVQNLLTVFRLGTVAALVGLGVLFGVKAGGSNFHPLFPAGPAFPAILKPLGLALVAVFWTYDGWYSVNCTAEEIRDPERTIPRGLTLGVLTVTAIYVLVNFVYLLALPLDRLKGVVRVGELAASALFGGGGAALFSALVMVSIFGCLNANILFGPRVFYAMARDGHFFRAMGRLGAPEPGAHRGPLGTGRLVVRPLPLGDVRIALRVHGLRPAPLLRGDGTGRLRPAAASAGRGPPLSDLGLPVVPVVFIVMSPGRLRQHRRQPAAEIAGRGRAPRRRHPRLPDLEGPWRAAPRPGQKRIPPERDFV